MKCTFHIGQTKTHISHPYSCVQDHIAVQSSEQSRPPLSPQAWLLWSLLLGVTQKWDMHHTQQMCTEGTKHKASWMLGELLQSSGTIESCVIATLIGAQSSFRGISNHGFCRRPSNHEFQTSNPIISRSWREKLEPFFKKDKVTNYVQEILNHQWKTISPQEINSQSLEDA